MPRKPRFFLADISAHIVQRGHSREPVFFEDGDYRAYLTWLGEAARRYDCAIHAYVLMTNHVHLLATPADKHGISRRNHLLLPEIIGGRSKWFRRQRALYRAS